MNKPKLRFPEFDGIWEEKEFGNFCFVNMGQSPSSENYTDNSNYTILIQGNADLKNGKVVPRIFTKEITKISEPGDIILTVRAPVGDIAINNYLACIGRGVCSIKGDKFVYYLLDHLNEINVWKKLSQGSTFEAISSSDIKNLKVNIPSSTEQQKIASFLSAVDEKIGFLEKKQDLWKTYKKGIIEQIFRQKLRFKDENGEDYLDWKDKKLGKVSYVKDGTHDSPKYVKEGFPLITSKNLMKNAKIDFDNVNQISKDDYNSINKRSKVDVGDILFGMIGTIGNPVIVDSEGFAIKNVALIKEKKVLKNSFLIFVLNTDIIAKQFYTLNAGGTQKFIALGLIRELNIPIPSLEEQEKIGPFLSKLDEKLDLIQKEITVHKQFKKGLLQQMFC